MARDDDPDRLSASEVRETLQNMDPADWARAEGIARLMARGLRGMTSEDLLDEVCVLLLGGERRFPGSVHPLVVLKTAMRSEADNARKSAWVRRIDDRLAVEPENDADDSDDPEDFRPLAPGAADRRTPEVEVLAREHFDAVAAAVAEDPEVELVAMAWTDGLRGSAAMEATGLDAKAYDAARKRLLRKLGAIGPHGGEP